MSSRRPVSIATRRSGTSAPAAPSSHGRPNTGCTAGSTWGAGAGAQPGRLPGARLTHRATGQPGALGASPHLPQKSSSQPTVSSREGRRQTRLCTQGPALSCQVLTRPDPPLRRPGAGVTQPHSQPGSPAPRTTYDPTQASLPLMTAEGREAPAGGSLSPTHVARTGTRRVRGWRSTGRAAGMPRSHWCRAPGETPMRLPGLSTPKMPFPCFQVRMFLQRHKE